MKNRSCRYNINTLRPGHGHKYTKYKMSLIMMMVTCIKQRIRNIWTSFHENVNTETELKKRCL